MKVLNPLVMMVVMVVLFVSLPASAFVLIKDDNMYGKQYARRTLKMMSGGDDTSNNAVNHNRKRRILGKVPIVSRTIPIEINLPIDDANDNNDKILNVTVWEMDKPAGKQYELYKCHLLSILS